MGLKEDVTKSLKIESVQRVEYFDSRYYKVQGKSDDGEFSEYFPSVTEILGAYPKDFLARWRGDVGNDRADQIITEALNLGSIIHYGAEAIALGGVVVYNPLTNPIYSEEQIENLRRTYNKVVVVRFQKEYMQLYRIQQFFDMVKPTEIQAEQTVYSLKHKYAGTLDVICKLEPGIYSIAGSKPLGLKGGYYICDYKTGKSVDDTYRMQISAYMKAVLEGRPRWKTKFAGCLILHSNAETVTTGIAGFKAHLVTMGEVDMYFNSFLKVYDVYKIHKPVPTPKTFFIPTQLFYKQPELVKKASTRKRTPKHGEEEVATSNAVNQDTTLGISNELK
jgi:hypothetical protein